MKSQEHGNRWAEESSLKDQESILSADLIVPWTAGGGRGCGGDGGAPCRGNPGSATGPARPCWSPPELARARRSRPSVSRPRRSSASVVVRRCARVQCSAVGLGFFWLKAVGLGFWENWRRARPGEEGELYIFGTGGACVAAGGPACGGACLRAGSGRVPALVHIGREWAGPEEIPRSHLPPVEPSVVFWHCESLLHVK
jgi:hypothetical protein